MTKKIFISELSSKDNVDTTFLVKYLNVAEARDGKTYLNIILTDREGDLEARKWHGAEQVIANIRKGDYVRAAGKLNNYQGRNQLIISHIEKIDESIIVKDDYVIPSNVNSEQLSKQLWSIIEKLDDYYIRTLITNILKKESIKQPLLSWSAAKSIHHAYPGGLLEHLVSCAKLAVDLSVHYSTNHNYVIAGAILHDLAKIFELSDGPVVEYTDEGKLIGHLAQVYELVILEIAAISGFPAETAMHLKHIILSHHGEYQYGSPKVPQTSEAMLVHLIDLMDSKMHSLELAKKVDNQPGNWSGFVKHLDRIVYKKQLPTSKEKNSSDKSSSSKEQTAKSGTMAKLLKDIVIDDN